MERQRRILASLRERQRVEVADLAEHLACSEMTIRRDLDTLAEIGAARRVRGGAVSLLTGEETPFPARMHLAGPAKRAIAATAAGLIGDGETVIIDSGTTALEVAKLLAGRDLTVMPLSLPAATALGTGQRPRVVMPGGEVRPGELTMIGPLAQETVRRMRFDTFVLGCCGIDLRSGVTAHDVADAAVKRAAVDVARRVIAVADSSKLGKVAFGVVCGVSRLDLLVTAPDQDAAARHELVSAGLAVRVAGSVP